jgi:hypothetical protein
MKTFLAIYDFNKHVHYVVFQILILLDILRLVHGLVSSVRRSTGNSGAIHTYIHGLSLYVREEYLLSVVFSGCKMVSYSQRRT